MKAIKHTLLLATAAVAGIAFVGLGSVQASTIISDTFSGTNSSYMNGRTPDTADVPGTNWISTGSSIGGTAPTGGIWENDIQSNQAKLGADVGDAIDLNSLSTVYNLSDSFNLANNADSDSASQRGAGLGFFSSAAYMADGYVNFTGLAVNPFGDVTLLTSPGTSVATVLATTTVIGFNSAINHTLSYSVNTTTGGISNILLDGSSIALTPSSNPFTPANTVYAGIYSSQSSGSAYTTFQNFTVSTPEPATLGLVAVGGLGLLLLKRRRTA